MREKEGEKRRERESERNSRDGRSSGRRIAFLLFSHRGVVEEELQLVELGDYVAVLEDVVELFL